MVSFGSFSALLISTGVNPNTGSTVCVGGVEFLDLVTLVGRLTAVSNVTDLFEQESYSSELGSQKLVV